MTADRHWSNWKGNSTSIAGLVKDSEEMSVNEAVFNMVPWGDMPLCERLKAMHAEGRLVTNEETEQACFNMLFPGFRPQA